MNIILKQRNLGWSRSEQILADMDKLAWQSIPDNGEPLTPFSHYFWEQAQIITKKKELETNHPELQLG